MTLYGFLAGLLFTAVFIVGPDILISQLARNSNWKRDIIYKEKMRELEQMQLQVQQQRAHRLERERRLKNIRRIRKMRQQRQRYQH